ncbi:cytochrome P450 [Sphingomonas crocodyli]|uniref:cytochrome P450 n=1 Tax=Sphingomonas crocodyli TaxID=1979270 RepID=UPI0019CFD188|nr:cytochrome P450 [Sphingomonas crocodyli]
MTEHCPIHAGRQGDDRKTAGAVAGGPTATADRIADHAGVRTVLRDESATQAGFKADLIRRYADMRFAPILFLEGDAHRRQRAATARFFAPRTVTTRYRELIEAEADALIGGFRAKREATLDRMSLRLAVAVAADIVGLTNSDRDGMARRLDRFFDADLALKDNKLAQFASFFQGQFRLWSFYFRDVRPAIRARMKTPREDVISHLIAEGYSDRSILTECFTYGAAGMVTTREFITMAAWHLLENRPLADRFRSVDEAGRLAILEEILRLEPVVGTLYRQREGEAGPIALDIRAANADAEAMGACPHRLDPDRERAPRVGAAGLAFGDGAHRCPGAGVALLEAAIFLDRLLRVPGIRLEQAPSIGWNPLITGYELRGCRIGCD